MSARSTNERNPLTRIQRQPRTGRLPLSWEQEQLWFLEQLEPNRALQSVPCAVRLSGPLDVSALEQSLNEIVRRHEILRTTFSDQEGAAGQVIQKYQVRPLSVIDLASLAPDAAKTEAHRLASEEACRPFDLKTGPLFRRFLLRLGLDEHVLVLNFHHIVIDGWSMGVFTKELGSFYESFFRREPASLPEPALQYADFAVWQRSSSDEESWDRSLSYWTQRLAGIPTLDLPTDYPRPPVQSFAGKHLPVDFPPSLCRSLQSLSQRERVTLFITLLAGFKIMLASYTNQEDLVVGSAIANRSRKELEDLVGFFVNTLPLRTSLAGDPAFLALLTRVRETVIEACGHQGVPLTAQLKQLNPDRDPSRNPLFQVEFSLLTPDHNPAVYGYGLGIGPLQTLVLPGITVSSAEISYGVSRFDLSVFLWQLPGRISGAVEYCSDLFETSTIEEMVRRFQDALQLGVDNPSTRLSAIVQDLGRRTQDEQSKEESTYQTALRDHLARSRLDG